MSINSHSFNVELATKIGLQEAIILQHFYWWYQRALNLPDMYREGRAWFFRSVAEIREVFPYLTESNTRTAIQHLIDGGFVIKGNYSESTMNKSTWYTLSDLGVSLFHLSESTNPFVKSTNGFEDLSNDIDNRNIDNRKVYRKDNNIRFIKPSFDEVDAYCRERGNNIDAQAFIDHYTANGWKVGANPMKDWKAAIRTWERRRQDNGFESVYTKNARIMRSLINPDEQ